MCKFPNEKCVGSSQKEKDKLEYNGTIIQYYAQKASGALNIPN